MDDEIDAVSAKGLFSAQRESNENRTRALSSGASWSGYERNYVFFGGLPGHQFADLSLVSGIDDVADGQSFSLLDYDHDGWLDILLVNRNTPRVRLFRNLLGESGYGSDKHSIAFRFVGGNREARPSSEWSSRDGLGASVELELSDGVTIYREHQTESSLKAQNSSTMLVGLSGRDTVRKLKVRWLSGKSNQAANVPAGTLVTVYENPNDSPTGESVVVEPYGKNARHSIAIPGTDRWRTGLLPQAPTTSRFTVEDRGDGKPAERGRLVLYTTMATWCVACVEEMPEFRQLRAAFSQDELAMYGLPIDPEDDEVMLQGWFEDKKPPYDLLIGLPEPEVARVNEIVMSELRFDGVPAAIVTDASGRVVLARWGVPSVSDLRKLLWMSGAEGQAHGTSE